MVVLEVVESSVTCLFVCLAEDPQVNLITTRHTIIQKNENCYTRQTHI